MHPHLKRESLVTQVADLLQRELPRYKRFKWLPSERVLCERFQVSRTTLRAVLGQLQRRGLIVAVPRCGHRIKAPVRGAAERESRLIVCLQEDAFEASESQAQVLIRNIEHILNTAGYEMKIERRFHRRGRNHDQWLSGTAAAHHAAGWMLGACSLETQRWFAQHKIPALVMGSCHPDVELPNMDIDYRAICRHAVIHLWRQGHRRIAFLTPRQRLGGDIQSELGFAEGWRQVAGIAGKPCFIHHDGSVKGLTQALGDGLAGSQAPTALLVSRSMHALTVVGYVTCRGIRLPKDISVVCRDSADFLMRFIPTIAHYAVDWDVVARRCARALIQLATAGRLPQRPHLIMARFVPGATTSAPGNACPVFPAIRR